MGAVPKRRISKSRRNRRRAHHALDLPHLVACEECGEMKRPHYACHVCGTYTITKGGNSSKKGESLKLQVIEVWEE